MYVIDEGIKIIMSDHEALDIPHAHVFYESFHTLLSIKTGKIIKGAFPSDKAQIAENWIIINDQKVIHDWKMFHKEKVAETVKRTAHLLSEFLDIQVVMTFKERSVPVVEATYESNKGFFSIESAELIDVVGDNVDDFPYKQRCFVSAWIVIHKTELMDDWKQLAENPNSMLSPIRPLA